MTRQARGERGRGGEGGDARATICSGVSRRLPLSLSPPLLPLLSAVKPPQRPVVQQQQGKNGRVTAIGLAARPTMKQASTAR